MTSQSIYPLHTQSFNIESLPLKGCRDCRLQSMGKLTLLRIYIYYIYIGFKREVLSSRIDQLNRSHLALGSDSWREFLLSDASRVSFLSWDVSKRPKSQWRPETQIADRDASHSGLITQKICMQILSGQCATACWFNGPSHRGISQEQWYASSGSK